jgi:hypothetical protein
MVGVGESRPGEGGEIFSYSDQTEISSLEDLEVWPAIYHGRGVLLATPLALTT